MAEGSERHEVLNTCIEHLLFYVLIGECRLAFVRADDLLASRKETKHTVLEIQKDSLSFADWQSRSTRVFVSVDCIDGDTADVPLQV